ncbi:MULTISPECIES: TIGR01777 family oxidoreductase [unclassified Pseudoalteromonas]|uniref:TIGR01777 family oxidoreductase n=1 Tax=unclassified Pseudoalteromonas TaxID=194690 RepID=UPI000C07CCF5|nr:MULTISPECIES: TIGR01777 family oxidoreductase [unclassified Pseudoalteromonas]MDP2633776.1 TIGR01777 family oxidoreductase [Pseudoalteromonas sp. 1_MG-2023]PHN89889.1 TIGR01777 family protein [Pseudoalteromonas sp. 3D05]
MKILITGATGLIGTQLCAQLVKTHSLTVLTRDSDKAKQKLSGQIDFINALCDIDFNTLDCVINLAGEPIVNKRWSDKQKEIIRNSRIELTQEIAAAIKSSSNPPHTFISGSAIGYYGRQETQHIDEQFTKVHQEFSHTLCNDWESAARNAETDSTRVCLIRTGIVLSTNGGALQKMLPPFKLGLGGPVASGEQGMSWIHINDMVSLIEFVMNNQHLTGAINATAPIPQSNRAFSKSLAKLLHRPAIFPMPAWVLNLAMGEMADLLIFGQYVIPSKLLDAGFEFQYPDLHPALESLLDN